MRFLVVPKKMILASISIIMLIITLLVGSSNQSMAMVFFNKPFRKVPIYCVETEEKKVAISFDAAWGADKTRDIMSALEKYEANATFFLVGFWIDKYSDVVKEIEERGFEIGSHSNTHPDLSKLTREAVRQELVTTNNKLEQIVKQKIKVFRFPFGAYNNVSIEEAEKLGLTPIQWDVDSLDWKGISAEKICSNVLTKVKNGSIILCHNNADHIVTALPTILSTLKTRGYKVVSVSELIYQDNYSINSQGIQIKNGD